jgi:hypothetical protein
MDAKRLAIAALVAGLMIAAPAAAQGTFTEAWAGTWNLEEGLRTCDTTVILGTSERTVEIAAGDSPADWDNQLSFSAASVDITDTVFDYGGGSTVIDGGCTVVTTVDYDMTRDGDSLTGLKRVDIVVTGCPGSACTEYVITGSRGGSPVEQSTWTTVKAIYD